MTYETHDITAQSIFNQLQATPRADGFGKLILIGSAHSGSGTSYAARAIALAGAAHFKPLGQRVLLLDYDLYKQTQLQSVMETGAVNGPYDASFGVRPFWQIRAGVNQDSPELPAASYGSLYLQDITGLAVTVFRWDQIGANQSVNIISSPEYWAALRQNFAMVIIDGPALDRTNMSAALYPEMDHIAIAARPQIANSPQTLQMAQDIQAHSLHSGAHLGGNFSGLILNDAVNGKA